MQIYENYKISTLTEYEGIINFVLNSNHVSFIIIYQVI